MVHEFDDLYNFSVGLFDKENVEREDYKDPDGIHLTVNVHAAEGPIKKVELSIYRGDVPESFMLPDDFRFEYDADEARAIADMKKYLRAISEGRVYIKAWNILGLKLNQRLLVRDGS